MGRQLLVVELGQGTDHWRVIEDPRYPLTQHYSSPLSIRDSDFQRVLASCGDDGCASGDYWALYCTWDKVAVEEEPRWEHVGGWLHLMAQAGARLRSFESCRDRRAFFPCPFQMTSFPKLLRDDGYDCGVGDCSHRSTWRVPWQDKAQSWLRILPLSDLLLRDCDGCGDCDYATDVSCGDRNHTLRDDHSSIPPMRRSGGLVATSLCSERSHRLQTGIACSNTFCSSAWNCWMSWVGLLPLTWHDVEMMMMMHWACNHRSDTRPAMMRAD